MSMGGMIVQALAIDHPSKVASVTSIMSNTGDRRYGKPRTALLAKINRLQIRNRDGSADVLIERIVKLFQLISGPHYDEAEVREMAAESLARNVDTVGVLRQMLAILASPARTRGLRKVAAPMLVIHGLVDPLVNPSGAMATARAVPGSRLLTFPDMGHDLPRPRWDEMIEAITDNARRGGFVN
jgi:pimeloyl-ACP methyl ester carboxylesterase